VDSLIVHCGVRREVANHFCYVKLLFKFLNITLPVYRLYTAGINLYDLYHAGRKQTQSVQRINICVFYLSFFARVGGGCMQGFGGET
jgi:hypothetical protein